MRKTYLIGVSLVFLFSFLSSVNATEQKTQDLMLESLGVLSAQGIYLTYTSIGTVVDGYTKTAYDKKTAFELVQEFINLANLAKEQTTRIKNY